MELDRRPLTIPRKPLPNRTTHTTLHEDGTDSNDQDYGEDYTRPRDQAIKHNSSTNISSPDPTGCTALLAATHDSVKLAQPLARVASAPRSSQDKGYTTGSVKSLYARGMLQKWSWLCRTVIWMHCADFVILIIALILLYHYSQLRDGFSITESTNPYTWKYGPTAVLVIVIALWLQVDYRLKLQAPWARMQSTSCPVEDSVLLDYITPSWPSVLLSSARNRDWKVIASLTTHLLLRIVVLFSTGLFIASSTQITRTDVDITLDLGGKHTLPAVNSNQVVLSYYGMLEKGLDAPPRTTFSAAFQEFAASNKFPPGAVVTADVLAFFSHLDCEPADVTHWQVTDLVSDNPGEVFNTTWDRFGFRSRECYVETASVLPICNPNTTICKPVAYFGQTSGVYCAKFDTTHAGNQFSTGILVFLIEVDTEQILAHNSTATHVSISAASQSIGATSAFICQPSYAIEKARLTVDIARPKAPGGTVLSGPLTNTNGSLEYYSNVDFISDITDVIVAADWYIPGTQFPFADTIDYRGIDTTFDLMMYLASTTDVQYFFENSTSLPLLADRVWQGIAAQWVGTWLSLPENLATNGSYRYQEQRLHVEQSSLWAMCLCLALATISASVIAIMHVHRDLPKHSDSVLSQAISLRHSSEFHDMISGSGQSSNAELRHSLFNSWFKLNTESSTATIEVLATEGVYPVEKGTRDSKSGQIKWWRPFPNSRTFMVLAVCPPLLIIVLLEVLQQLSDSNQGIVDVSIARSTGQALAAYLAAAITLSISAAYSSVESTLAIFAPYHAAKGSHATWQNFRHNPLREPSASALVNAVRRKEFAVALAIFAAVLGSILTIISSGLYTVDYVPKAQLETISAADQFNLRWAESTDIGGDTMYALVTTLNASYPKGSFEEYAYPYFSLSDAQQELISLYGATQLEVNMPVTRASLNCSVVPRTQIQVTVNDQKFETPQAPGAYVDVAAILDLSQDCQHSLGAYFNSTQFQITTYPYMPVPHTGFSWGAQMSVPFPYNGSNNDWPLTYYAPRCPSLSFQFGRYHYLQDSKENTTLLVCSQYQEEIPAALTFLLPSLALDTSRPPVLYESKARVVGQSQYWFQNIFGFGPGAIFGVGNIDDFFNQIVGGAEAVPLEDLVGEQNEGRLVDSVQHVYRKFMAQVVNDAMRLNSTNSTTDNPNGTPVGTPLQAKIFDPSRLRLMQHRTSKIILQALLATMLACFVANWWMMDMRTTLPHNPYTIAGAMSLLAGSELVKAIGDNEDEEDLQERFKGRKLRLGWWPDDDHDDNGNDNDGGSRREDGLRETKAKRFGIDLVKDGDRRS